MVKRICKRCGFTPRHDDPFHNGFGAMSRTDDCTLICCDCGVEEALENLLGDVTSKDLWPI